MPMAIRLLSAGKVSYALTENLEVFNDLNIFKNGCAVMLPKIKSFFKVAKDVKKVISEIDNFFLSLKCKLPKEILVWGLHIEGGLTGQKIQDYLLLIEQGVDLARNLEPSEILIIANPEFIYEDKIMIMSLRSLGISVKRKRYFTDELYAKLFLHLRSFGKLLWLLLKITLFKFSSASQRRVPDTIAQDQPISVFQICSDSNAHLRITSHMADRFLELGIKPVLLTWLIGNVRGSIVLRDHELRSKFTIYEQEQFINWTDIFKVPFVLLNLLIGYFRAIKKLRPIAYHGVIINDIFRPLIFNSLIYRAPTNFLFYKSLLRFLDDFPINFFKPWGGDVLCEGRISIELLRKKILKARVFNYWIGVSFDNDPYASCDDKLKPDLFLAKNLHERNIALKNYGYKDDQVYVFDGLIKNNDDVELGKDKIEKFRKKNLIKSHYDVYVAVDPGCNLLGYQTLNEQVELLSVIRDAALCSPNVCYVIKPHPAYKIHDLLNHYNYFLNFDNIKLVDSEADSFEWIIASDIVISKYSTILLEAAMLSRPTIAAILDGESRFKIFGDMSDVHYDVNSLLNFLTTTVADKSMYENWRNLRIRIQGDILRSDYGFSETSEI